MGIEVHRGSQYVCIYLIYRFYTRPVFLSNKKINGVAGPIVCSYKSLPLEWSSYSSCNSHFQDLQLFTVASLGLLPVILSGIKCCDSQQGDSVSISSTVKHSKTVCIGNNSTTQSTYSTSSRTSTISPHFLYSMQQKAGEEPGNEATITHYPSFSYTHAHTHTYTHTHPITLPHTHIW